MIDPTAMIMADRLTRRQVTSARPDAPVVHDGPGRAPRRRARRDGARRALAVVLRRVADRLEPGASRASLPAA